MAQSSRPVAEGVVSVRSEDWNREVLQVPSLVMVVFGASWCKPCVAISPMIEELAKEYEGRLKILTLDIDANDDIASTYKITIVPTVIFFKGPQKLHEIICAVPKTQLQASIENLL